MNTDTLNPLVAAALDEYRKRVTEVEAIDEKLNTDGGQGALARAAIENYPNSDAVTATVTNLVADVAGADLLAVVTLARKVLNTVSDQVKAYVEANKTDVPELPADEEAKLRVQRKAAVDAANMFRQAVSMANPQWAEANLDTLMPVLVNKKGAGKGPRAPRLRGAFRWTVDGEFAGDKLADAHKAIGITGAEFKEALAATYAEKVGENFDQDEFFKNPPDRIEFRITRGEGDKQVTYVVVGRKEESDTESDDDDENYDEPDTTEATVTEDEDDLFG